ncbi:MAG: metalloregulator ArsR/SmtB family transcription factor, partial [Gemmatimonadetes bacterium]|nr:metalloregulator ArsR/SmtB family transcription factor [Gemmatimonadota bacterium]
DADVEIFKACADETRLRILVLLGEGQLCVCEIVDVLDMPQGKISRHLAVLRRAGLVEDERRGTWIHYSLNKGSSPLMKRLRSYLRAEARQSETACCDLERLQQLCDCGEICVDGRRLAVGTRAERIAAVSP